MHVFRSNLLLAFALACASTMLAQNDQQRARTAEQRSGGPYLTRPDLADRVAYRLFKRPTFSGTQMDVVAAEGVVTLTGTVPDERAKKRAEQIAMSTPGVEKVNNLLTLNPQMQRVRRDPIVTDEELSKAVAGAIAKRFYPGRAEVDRAILAYHYQVEGPNFEIDVYVDGSEVILEGTVPDSRKIREIVQFVHRFPGVHTVDQQLRPNIMDDRWTPTPSWDY